MPRAGKARARCGRSCPRRGRNESRHRCKRWPGGFRPSTFFGSWRPLARVESGLAISAQPEAANMPKNSALKGAVLVGFVFFAIVAGILYMAVKQVITGEM